MSYREENGQVILSMSSEDFLLLLDALLIARRILPAIPALLKRLIEGYATPYQVEKERSRNA